MRWTGHVARMGRREVLIGYWWESQKERDHYEDQDVGGWAIYFFLILVCEAIGTAATPGLLCQPRVIVKIFVEKQMECRLAGETEVLRENLPQRHFCPSQNSAVGSRRLTA
jgi:hypothetical protein